MTQTDQQTQKTLAQRQPIAKNPKPDRCHYNVYKDGSEFGFAPREQCNRRHVVTVCGVPFCKQHGGIVRKWAYRNNYDPDAPGPYLVPMADTLAEQKRQAAIEAAARQVQRLPMVTWHADRFVGKAPFLYQADLPLAITILINQVAEGWEYQIKRGGYGGNMIDHGRGYQTPQAAAQVAMAEARAMIEKAAQALAELATQALPNE